MKEYQEFLMTKQEAVKALGFNVSKEEINSILFPFQRDIVVWSLKMGRSAIFADCGMGKSFMQIEYGYHVNKHTNKPVLFASPLAVSGQTIEEAQKLGYKMHYARSMTDLSGDEQLVITNYEMLHKFRMDYFGGLVIDESSILKNFTGKTKRLLLKMAQDVDYRLACTATPAPNDHLELGNHAEFLGIMKSNEMIQRYFVNDTMKAGGYRLRGHSVDTFWRWVASWAVSLRKPSDVGDYNDDGYILPDLIFHNEVVMVDHSRAWNEVNKKSGQMSLLLVGNTSATAMHKEKRATISNRMKQAANKVNEILESNPNESIIVWCEYNYEADELISLLPDAVEVRGSEKLETKREKLLGFSRGDYQVLITKPKIAAHGLNWQHCGHQIWTSINHKFEPFYQGYKRSHRFGRTEPVHCYIVYAESEGSILSNLERKHKEHELMSAEMVRAMKENGMSLEGGHQMRLMGDYSSVEFGDGWELYHGDSAITMQGKSSNEVDLIVQSPPFKGLYIYSSNVEDLGNCVDDNQFFEQYQYILNDELRRMKQGAIKAEHCKDLPLYANRDGAMGLQDFPGELIEAHKEAGFWFVGWKTIWKDPVIEMQRTKNAGLLWSSAFCQRAERARQGMADYVLIFQKPIEGEDPPKTAVDHTPIPESVVNRCIDLWSMQGGNTQSPYTKFDNSKPIDLMICNTSITGIMGQIDSIKHWLRDGRNLVCRMNDCAEMHILIERMRHHRMIFHSRVALTDGTWLVVFRKWVNDMSEKNQNIKHVTHDLIAPSLIGDNDPNAHVFVGSDGPKFYSDDRDYSIQVWQRYASPVWYDLDGLPNYHNDIWMNIHQTNVLNHKAAREDKDEKHICPLQIDVIERCIADYTGEGDMVSSSFVGIGSEIATAVKMNRLAYGSELKHSYWKMAVENIREVETNKNQISLFDLLEVA